MTRVAEFPQIAKPALLGRLAQGHAVRTSVVTPNLRLAAALRRDFDAQQTAAGLVVWEAADILPLSALVERLYEDALYGDPDTRVPILLTPAQEHALWEDIVRASEAGGALLWAPGAAALAREAWQLANAWRLIPKLKGYPANDDARAFADWAWRYEGVTQRDRHCERARLADVLAPHLAHPALGKPATLVVYGFDIVSAQQREFIAALAQAGVEILTCGPEVHAAPGARARRVAFASATDEIGAAANWARARLEADPRARIGVVVPDLARSRTLVQRIFTRAMEPAHGLPVAGQRSLPFNLSLGEPLASYALVAAALRMLAFAREEIEFEQASRLLRSPFIAGAETELAQRARLDAALRRIAGAKTGLERLRRAIAKLTAAAGSVPACPILSQRLAELSKLAKEHLHAAKQPGEWAKIIALLLDAAGFPGERTLDSIEYQLLKKFHAAIAGFAALDRVAPRMRFGEACARLARIAADTLFQPEAPQVPIQVLGVLESAGLEFDHLWVMGLTDEAWPIPARPNPFIPVALQRAAGVPEASAAASLDLDARITRGWCNAAAEVIFSYPLREQDRDLAPSPLVRDVPESTWQDIAPPACESLREAIRRARGEERSVDAKGPALNLSAKASGNAHATLPVTHAGGTGVFRDQAACPFRAFALHRLRAQGLEAPPSGLDASERGTLLHAMLAKVWQELRSKARLQAASQTDLEALLALAAAHAIERLRARRPEAIEGRYAELEQARLARLGSAWLEIERGRTEFEVAAVEHECVVSYGGLTVNARLDRVDRIVGAGEAGGAGAAGPGALAVIDYKTGEASIGDWLGPRPDDPQLPLYAVSRSAGREEAMCAVAFACVRAGELEFKGVARDEGLIPGVRPLAGLRLQAARDYASWEELLEGWRYELDALGREFSAGEARVQPKRGEQTCRYCELKPLCRIDERAVSTGDEA